MSQNEFDDEFAALLGDEGMAEVDAMLTDDPKAASTADATVKVNTLPAPATQEAKQAATAPKPSIIGKKRQLLVPQVAAAKRKSVQVQSPTSASDATALASKDPSPSSPAPAPAPAPAEAAPEAADAAQEPEQATTDPEPSAASSPTKAKSPAAAAESADDTKATPSPSEMEVEADKGEDQVDTEMADAAAPADEPEVQSPLKKASAPEEPADKPSTAAASGGAPSSRAASGGAPSARAKLVVKPAAASAAPSAVSKLSAALAPKPGAVKLKAAKAPAAPKASKDTSSSAAAGGCKAAAATALKMPKAQTAFMFFSADTRRALKETEPGLSMPDVAKRCGEMWRELSEEEKKPYHDMATDDKERVNLEIAAMDPDKKAAIAQAAADAKAAKQQKKTDKADKAEERKEAQAAAKEAKKSEKAAEKAAAKAEEKAKKQAAKAAKEAAVKKEKDGFKMFHSSQYATVKADNPGKDATEINALVQSAWDQMDQAEKDAYMKKAEEAAEAAAAARAMDAKKPAKSKGSKSAGKRSKKASAGTDDEGEGHSDGEGTEATGGGSSRRRAAAPEDEDDDSDREDVDWEGHPSEYIMTHGDGAFQVVREGLMLTEYGKVDTRKAKERLLLGELGGAGSSSEAELPVSSQQVEEYERSCQKFWAALKSRMTKDSLYLEELEEGSPLELCYVLGKLQEKGMVLEPKTKYPKGEPDILRRLPVMRLSMVVQRLLDMERSKAKQAVARRDEVLSAMVDAAKDKTDSDGLDKAVAAAAALLEGSA